jgi:hypothetical protein
VTKNLKVGLSVAVAIVVAAVGAFAIRQSATTNPPPASPAPATGAPTASTQDSGSAPAPAGQAPPAAQGGEPDAMPPPGSAFASCHAPPGLSIPPDGATASKDEMIAARRAAATFNEAMNHYFDCLDSTTNDLKAKYSSVASAEWLGQVEYVHTELHNAAFERLQSDVQRFNKELVKFKEAQSPRG